MFFDFIKAFIRNPRTTGALFPSSRRLTQAMAAQVLHKDGIVVELGAGTGVVTEALLQAEISPSNIVIIESSADFVKKLRQRFPDIHCIEGNAAHLISLLGDEYSKVNTVISSIPLRSLPKSRTQAILQQIQMILPVGGRYIQFTYSLNLKHNWMAPAMNYTRIFSKRIWLNLPPARVDVWEKSK